MKNYQNQFKSTLSEIKKNGLFKEERIINSSQQIKIKTKVSKITKKTDHYIIETSSG